MENSKLSIEKCDNNRIYTPNYNQFPPQNYNQYPQQNQGQMPPPDYNQYPPQNQQQMPPPNYNQYPPQNMCGDQTPMAQNNIDQSQNSSIFGNNQEECGYNSNQAY